MGIGVVLIVYLVVLSVAAAICGAILVAGTRWYLRGVPAGRARLTTYAALIPFVCAMYAGVWFVAYAAINDVVFHHDPMIGDSWFTDIGNGYAIDMIDVTDHGIVHPIEGEDRGLNSTEAVDGVRRMQIAGTRIFGSEDKNVFQNFGSGKQEENLFFAIDTQSHAKKEFPTEADLAAYAKQSGVNLSLRPIQDVYSDYRNNWFEVVAGIVLLLVPAFAFWRLSRRAVMLKREGLKLAKTEG